MARRRHFIRLLPRLPEARNSSIRDPEHQAQPFTRDLPEHSRERVHRMQRDDRPPKAIDGAVPGAGILEIELARTTDFREDLPVRVDSRTFEDRRH